MEVLFLIGRILFGGMFIYSGIKHFSAHKTYTSYAQSKNVPNAGIATWITGSIMLLGGIGVVLGLYTTISLWLIIVFLVPTTFWMHAFWKESDPGARAEAIVSFKTNMALVGAALMMIAGELSWIITV